MEVYKIIHPVTTESLEVSRADFDAFRQGDFAYQVSTFIRLKGMPAAAKTPEPQVADSIAATLVQRGSRYGDFTDHAAICQELKDVMTGCTKVNPEYPDQRIHGWQLLSSVQRQALEVIMDKVARILSGDPNYDDNWHDIQGYAKLVEDRLPCNQTKETPNV